MRAEQNLLVDFSYFPYKLIELLQRCLASASEAPPSFSAQITLIQEDGGRTAAAQLSFLETTSLRQVTQLNLKLRAVSDDALKRQLSEMLRQYREQISLLQSQLPSNGNVGNFVNRPSSSAAAAAVMTPQSTTSKKTPNGFSSMVREKDEACAHLNQLYEVTKEAKGRLDDENSELRHENEIVKQRFEESQQEVIKANEIIAKLQDEMRTLKAKLKSASAIADDQMTAADQLRQTNKRFQQELQELAEQSHAAKVQAETLERDNKALRNQIENLDRQIQQRDAIIAHHQRQTNVKDLDRAMRALDPNAIGPNATTTTTGAGETTTEFTFEEGTTPGGAFGYVGSRIFDQTF